MPPISVKLAFAGLAFCAAASAPAAPAYPAAEQFGVPFSKDEPWYRECMRVEQRTGVGHPAVQAAGPQSKASALYYRKRGQAATSQAEWDAVRTEALADGDNAVLMMLYANGFGVPRDTDIAIHYACSMDFVAKAEMEARVAHLAGARPSSAVFDQCDDITSGMMQGVCTDIRESQDLRVRAARLDRAAQTLPPGAQAAFRKLRAAADAYAGAAWKEVDGHGSAAAAFGIEHQARLREQFMQAVLDVLANKLGATPAPDAAHLDAELNAAYQKLMSTPSAQQDAPDRLGESTIKRNDVREIERLWIAYRDAFRAFQTALPATARSAPIEPLLISQRIADLKKIAGYL
jgi:hypothetical protein